MVISLDKLDSILEQLKGIRIKEAIQLRNRLLQEKTKQKYSKKIIKQTIKVSANQKRSSKLSKYWRYVKLIRDNFPDVTTNQIRSELKKRRQGKPSKIPDAIWQNPSG